MTNPSSGLSALLPRFLMIPHFEDKVFSVLKTAEYFWIFLSPFQQPRSRSHCTDDRNFFLVRGVQFINWLVSEFGWTFSCSMIFLFCFPDVLLIFLMVFDDVNGVGGDGKGRVSDAVLRRIWCFSKVVGIEKTTWNRARLFMPGLYVEDGLFERFSCHSHGVAVFWGITINCYNSMSYWKGIEIILNNSVVISFWSVNKSKGG